MRLLLKQWAAFRGALIALAVVVLVATFAVTAWPRAVTGLLTRDVQYRVDAPPAGITAVQTSVHALPAPVDGSLVGGSGGWVWDYFGSTLEGTYRSMSQPLRSALQAPQWTARTAPLATSGPRAATQYQLQLEAFAQLREEARLIKGTWPAAYEPHLRPAPADVGSLPAGVVYPSRMVPTTAPIEIVMTADSATAMSFAVGDTRPLSMGLSAQPVKLVGIVEPRDPSSPYWELQFQRAHPSDVQLGDAGSRITATAWLDPAPWGRMQFSFTSDALGWFGARAEAITWPNLASVRAQLAAFLSSSHEGTGGWVLLRYTTQFDEVLAGLQSGGASLQTLLILLATAPLGAAVAVLVLGAELLVDRRRAVLTLLSARGASAWWIRSRMAIEGLVAAIPAAVVGAVAAVLVTSGPVDAAAVAGAASCAVLPAVILAALARPAERAPRPRRRRWRWVLEVLVLAATAVAVFALVERGVRPDGVDPLLVLTPLLITLSAAVVVLRLYPLPLRALHGALRRGRGAIGLIGASRSVRGIRTSLIPVLVVLVGVATAVFSAVAFQTERAGVTQAALAHAGADVSVGDDGLTTAQAAGIRAVAGVSEVGVIRSAGYAGISNGGGSDFVEVLVADTARLSQIQAGLPEDVRVPDLTHTVDGKTPIVVGNWEEATGPGDVTLTTDAETTARIVSATTSLGAAAPNSAWILVDAAHVPDGLDEPAPSGALVALDSAHARGEDAVTATAAIAKIVGSGATIDSAAAQAEVIRAAPAVAGVETALLIATALGAALAVMALVLTLVTGARERLRLVGTLRTLGFDRRQTTGLVVWEVAPILATGLVGGLVAGLLLPFAVLVPLDLSSLTGGAQPPIAGDPMTISLVLAVFVVVVAAAVALAVWIASTRSPASVLRVGEEE
ncbi:FtsX-like permease family protein [Microbacterium rhizosphaerae]|uniref:FtsX-like permease family protein n=1 Tax=Microbacterium rhizosphaerae TaxID=1678237 RepID=A0ABZ0SRT0_9MICO|nr:FtsX-like permease family protein [Microbacterium rhizosphaerae]WPR90046.1 FtsX-like permease family protein [Microbacterium rhizosphaerae]